MVSRTGRRWWSTTFSDESISAQLHGGRFPNAGHCRNGSYGVAIASRKPSRRNPHLLSPSDTVLRMGRGPRRGRQDLPRLNVSRVCRAGSPALNITRQCAEPRETCACSAMPRCRTAPAAIEVPTQACFDSADCCNTLLHCATGNQHPPLLENRIASSIQLEVQGGHLREMLILQGMSNT